MGQGTNLGAASILEAWAAGKTIKCVLLSGNTTSWQTPATAQDFEFAEDIAADEPTGWSGYARPTLTSPAAVYDQVNDRAELDFADITFANLDSSAETVDGVAFIQVENDDTDSPILGIIDVTGEAAGDRTPDGNDFIVQIGADGLIWLLTDPPA